MKTHVANLVAPEFHIMTGPKPNCPWRKPPKHALDHAEKIAHVVGGMMFGAFASGAFVIESFFAVVNTESGTLWIPSGILLGSMALSGLLAWLFGHRFIDWIDDNWHQFWRRHGGHG